MDRPAVRRSVLRYTLYLALAQALCALLLAWRPGPPRLGWTYLASALALTLLVGCLMARNVHLLYTAEGRPLRRLNLATRITLIRVAALPLVVNLILYGHLFLAGLVFLAAALTDWLDGHLARRMGDVTRLGRIADPSIDALFCGVTILALAQIALLPVPVLVLALIRYGVLFGGAALLRLLLGILPVRATFWGRLFYLVQYTSLALLMLIGGGAAALWLVRALGAVQLLVIIQLLLLGSALYREARRDA